MAVVLRGVERWLGERKNPEDGGREENRARRPPPGRRGRVAWGTGGQSAERIGVQGELSAPFREVTVVTGAGAAPGKLALFPA